MRILSTAFDHEGMVPQKYTCDGENVNPPLLISDVPQDAESLVLIVDDPDAPMGTWVHWTVWNIHPSTTEIPEDSVPDDSVEGITSFGSVGYGGPCPGSGTARYFFKLYALDFPLELSPESEAEDIEEAIDEYVLEHAELMGRYGRGK